MPDETIESWLDQEIEWAENAYAMDRSYKIIDHAAGVNLGRVSALKEVRRKINKLWYNKDDYR